VVNRLSQACLLAFFAVLLMAAVPSWMTMPGSEWTEEQAKQVLTASPWVRAVTAGIARPLSEDELRNGGKMGEHHGAGYDGVVGNKSDDAKLPASLPELLVGSGIPSSRFHASATSVRVRWESALPVRLAELKIREIEPPALEGEGYQLAVYDVPGAYFKDDPAKLGGPLRNGSFLRRQGKKDVKPTRVEVFQRVNTLVVAFLFPLAAGLTKNDGIVEFQLHIGRITVAPHFDLSKMEYMGKLEL
jgi:hypothetical protein